MVNIRRTRLAQVSAIAATSGAIIFAAAAPGFSQPPKVTTDPTELTFSSQTVGSTSASQSVKANNPYPGPISFKSVKITGANANQFSIKNNGCSGVVAKESTCTVSVIFRPTTAGQSNASLDFDYQIPSGQQRWSPEPTTISVSLKGTATAAPKTCPLTVKGARSASRQLPVGKTVTLVKSMKTVRNCQLHITKTSLLRSLRGDIRAPKVTINQKTGKITAKIFSPKSTVKVTAQATAKKSPYEKDSKNWKRTWE